MRLTQGSDYIKRMVACKGQNTELQIKWQEDKVWFGFFI